MNNGRTALRKILSNKELPGILDNTANGLNTGVSILDADGGILASIGYPDLDSKAEIRTFPINIGGEQVGSVEGSGKSSVIASMINYAVAAEYDKRDLINEVSNRYKEINLFYDFTEKMLGCSSLKDITLLTLSLVKNFIKADTVSIMLRNHETNLIDVISAYNYDEKTIKTGVMAYDEKSVAEHVMVSGNAEIINDLSLDGRVTAASGKTGSMMCAPLKIRGKILGAIDITTENRTEFTSSDLKLFTTLSHNAAAFVENIRLYKQYQYPITST